MDDTVRQSADDEVADHEYNSQGCETTSDHRSWSTPAPPSSTVHIAHHNPSFIYYKILLFKVDTSAAQRRRSRSTAHSTSRVVRGLLELSRRSFFPRTLAIRAPSLSRVLCFATLLFLFSFLFFWSLILWSYRILVTVNCFGCIFLFSGSPFMYWYFKFRRCSCSLNGANVNSYGLYSPGCTWYI